MKNIVIACLSVMVIVLAGGLVYILPDATIDHLEVRRLTQENDAIRAENAVLVDALIQVEEALTFTGPALLQARARVMTLAYHDLMLRDVGPLFEETEAAESMRGGGGAAV
jgi:hypothetical protein